jgi:precorrin-6x reductase
MSNIYLIIRSCETCFALTTTAGLTLELDKQEKRKNLSQPHYYSEPSKFWGQGGAASNLDTYHPLACDLTQ